MRLLTQAERGLAQSVFGQAISLDKVLIAPCLAGRTAVTVGSTIHFPRDAPADFAAQPIATQAWLVHELTHVWQFQSHAARTVLSWAGVLLSGGYGPGRRGYDYRHPFDWSRLNLEQQARVVEHAFLLRAGAANASSGEGGPKLTLADYVGRTPFEDLTRKAEANA